MMTTLTITLPHTPRELSPNAKTPLTQRGAIVAGYKKTAAKSRARNIAWGRTCEALNGRRMMPTHYRVIWFSVTLWLYESGMDGTRDIIGKCRLVVTAGLQPYPPKGILEWTMKQACVTEEHILHYTPCFVWGVQDPVRLPHAVPLSAIGMARPPQSWQYLTPDQAAILERRVNDAN